MAFSGSSLQMLSVGSPSGPRIFSYSTSDTMATATAADYFVQEPQPLRAGDVILIKASNGEEFRRVLTASISAATVGDAQGGVWVQATVTGLGTPGTVGWAMSPIAGTIIGYRFLTTTAVDGDNVLNLEVGGTNCTGSLTIASSGSAAGVVVPAADSAPTAVTAGGTVTKGQAIKIESDGGGTTGAGVVFILIRP
jgi:hypothetical protein